MARNFARRRIFALRRGGATLLMILLCLGLAGVVYDELTAPADEVQPASPSAAPPPQRPAPKAEDATFTLPPIETYAEVTERPLFAQTRRPPPPETVQENIGNA